jgi:hypothetical protein
MQYPIVTIKTIAMISVVVTIIDHNVSLHRNNHHNCNNIKKMLQSAIAKLLLATTFNHSHTLLLLGAIVTNIILLQPYFMVIEGGGGGVNVCWWPLSPAAVSVHAPLHATCHHAPAPRR